MAETVGVFDLHCTASGLPLTDSAALLPIAFDGGLWRACALPQLDTYNRYGSLDSFALDEPLMAILDATEVPSMGDRARDVAYEDLLEELRDARGTWAGRPITYTLVDGPLYLAHVRQLEVDEPDLLAELLRATWSQLLARAFHFPESRSLYLKAPEDREALVRLCAFLHAKPTLTRAVELPHDQHCYASAAPFIEQARVRYAGRRALLEAVRASEARWRRYDDEDDDEEEAISEPEDARRLRLESLRFYRSMTGAQVLELSASDGQRLAGVLRRREPTLLRGPNCHVAIAFESTCAWRSDGDERFRIDVSSALSAELLERLDGSRAGELAELPGVRLQVG